ncbi:MAG: hypothetical protein LBG43_01370 [Treponema sp.]|nr:hypothetical protein [Treponema sp.]
MVLFEWGHETYTGEEGRRKGRFVRKDRTDTPDGMPAPVYLRDLRFEANLCEQVFKNKGGSAGAFGGQ